MQEYTKFWRFKKYGIATSAETKGIAPNFTSLLSIAMGDFTICVSPAHSTSSPSQRKLYFK